MTTKNKNNLLFLFLQNMFKCGFRHTTQFIICELIRKQNLVLTRIVNK